MPNDEVLETPNITPDDLSTMTDAQLTELENNFMKGQDTVSRALAVSSEQRKRREAAQDYEAYLLDKEAKKTQRAIESEQDRREEARLTIPRPNTLAEFSQLPRKVKCALIEHHSSDGDNFVEQLRRKPLTMSWEMFDALLLVAKKNKK